MAMTFGGKNLKGILFIVMAIETDNSSIFSGTRGAAASRHAIYSVDVTVLQHFHKLPWENAGKYHQLFLVQWHSTSVIGKLCTNLIIIFVIFLVCCVILFNLSHLVLCIYFFYAHEKLNIPDLAENMKHFVCSHKKSVDLFWYLDQIYLCVLIFLPMRSYWKYHSFKQANTIFTDSKINSDKCLQNMILQDI